MAILKLEHNFNCDIQAALLSSCKEEFSDNSVNFICKDGVVSCDRTVLILVSKTWQNIFLSSNTETEVVLTPDYCVNFIKSYIYSCIDSDYSASVKGSYEDEGFETSDADGKSSLEINMRDQEEGVCLEKNMEPCYSVKDDEDNGLETRDEDCRKTPEINMRDKEEGVCLEKNTEDCRTDHIENHSKHLISSLVDEFVNILCEICVEDEVLESEDPNIRYFLAPRVNNNKCPKVKCQFHASPNHQLLCPDSYIRNMQIYRKTKKIILKLNPYIDTFRVEESTTCNICLKRFSKPAHCRVHMKHAHSEEDKFRCDKCEMTFKSEKGLNTHLKTSHENESKNPFICSICGHVFLEKRSLVRHSKTNCTATKKTMLKNQSERVSRVYKCTKCDFKTARNDTLLRHEREIHYTFDMELKAIKNTFEKGKKSLYKCPNCKKTITTSEEVQKHIVRKVCLLTCNVCEKTFTRKETLKRHMKNIHKMEVGVSLEKKD